MIDGADKTIEDTAVRLYTTFLRYPNCDRQGFPQETGSIRGGPILSVPHLYAGVCAEVVTQIGLPQDKGKLPLLCILDPFVAGNGVLVTPYASFFIVGLSHRSSHITYARSVVVLILDNTLKVRPSLP
jgi:hypothetical protein